jgi:uncharacterized protein with FMN-binding domain
MAIPAFHLAVIQTCYDCSVPWQICQTEGEPELMSRNQFSLPSDPARAVRKLFLSAFVVFAFAAYALYERLTRPDTPPYSASTSGAASQASGKLLASIPVAPTAASSAYKDGTYQGQTIDAYYGLVQVQVSVQGGAIKGVQFLQYPNDRRTSQQINAIAMPYLQQEALQAQSANVDIISGATLTSEGFQMSLQSALQAAHN